MTVRTETFKNSGPEHYTKLKIQPIDFILTNNLSFCEGNAVKYLSRHKMKGKEKDIEKAIDYLSILLEDEYQYSKEQMTQVFHRILDNVHCR